MSDDFIEGVEACPCVVCGQLTAQVEINFEAYLHPGECERRLWREYVEALRRGEVHEGPELPTS